LLTVLSSLFVKQNKISSSSSSSSANDVTLVRY